MSQDIHARIEPEPLSLVRIGVYEHGQPCRVRGLHELAYRLQLWHRQVPDPTVATLKERFDTNRAIGLHS